MFLSQVVANDDDDEEEEEEEEEEEDVPVRISIGTHGGARYRYPTLRSYHFQRITVTGVAHGDSV